MIDFFALEIWITFISRVLQGPDMYPVSFTISFSTSNSWREFVTSTPKPVVTSDSGEAAECEQKSSSSLHVGYKKCYKTTKNTTWSFAEKIPFNINNFEGNIWAYKCKPHYTFLDWLKYLIGASNSETEFISQSQILKKRQFPYKIITTSENISLVWWTREKQPGLNVFLPNWLVVKYFTDNDWKIIKGHNKKLLASSK
jgi:hypothetical protein